MTKIRWIPFLYLVILLAGAIWIPMLSGFEANESQMDLVLCPASWSHPFGCDSLGRDLFVRVMLGARTTLGLGVVTTIIAFFLGVVFGFISGMSRPRIDVFMMKLLEVLMSIPQLILISLCVLFFYRKVESPIGLFFGIALSLCLGAWMLMAKITRGLVKKEIMLDYIEAARALGASRWRIAYHHVFPNIKWDLLVAAGLQIPGFLMFESVLSFIGVGLQPPTASWGLLIQEGWKTLSSFPQLVLFPGAVLFLTVASFNLLFRKRPV